MAVSNQFYTFPPINATSSSPSTGPTGNPVPSQANLIGGKSPTGILLPVLVDASGNIITSPSTAASVVTVVQPTGSLLHATIDASALPAGASTAALQTQISGQIPATLGQKVMASSLAVVIASDQSAIPVTGTFFQATQPVSTTQLPSTLGAKTGALSLSVVPNTDTAFPVTGTFFQATQPISAVSLPLPSGASTSALQTQISAQLPTTLGQKTSANSLAVVLASDQSSVPSTISGKTAVTFIRNDYSSVNVTTAAYVQLIASTSTAISELFIFDSSGQTLKIAFGAAASEVDKILVVPGGNGTVPLTIPAGTRVSIRAVSATASVGEIDINFFG